MQNAAAAGLILAYFWWFAGPWIWAGFTPDDLMNCHRALERPFGQLLLDHLTVFLPASELRPLGSLFYLVLYRSFGFHSFPFHLVLYTVLVANLLLTYLAVHRLTEVTSAAWIATIFHAWHGNWKIIDLSVGFCFDVLCYFCYVTALIAFGAGRLWLFLGLYMLSMNAKEIAVSLPVVCLVWKGWECRRSASAVIVAGLLTASFIGGRLLSRQGLAEIEPYSPHIDLTTFLTRVSAFLDMAAYGHGRLIWAVLILGAATAWSLIYHRRAAVVSLVVLIAGVLPVAFIPQRSLEAVYVPSLGAVTLLALPLSALFARPVPAVVAAMLLAGTFHHLRRDRHPEVHLAEACHIAEVVAQLRRAAPCLPPGAHVLFERDPFPQFDWNSLFLIHLVYNDLTMIVHRPGRPAYRRTTTSYSTGMPMAVGQATSESCGAGTPNLRAPTARQSICPQNNRVPRQTSSAISTNLMQSCAPMRHVPCVLRSGDRISGADWPLDAMRQVCPVVNEMLQGNRALVAYVTEFRHLLCLPQMVQSSFGVTPS